MTPVAKTGLHCGAEAITGTDEEWQAVTPVAKTGLHCGTTLEGNPWRRQRL